VQSIRSRVQDHFEEETLIEAIAFELERDTGSSPSPTSD